MKGEVSDKNSPCLKEGADEADLGGSPQIFSLIHRNLRRICGDPRLTEPTSTAA
ncbi:MAG TPA: hypothetical protein VFS17_07040 [Methylophilaceae bacterium]|nr:hypothetical protein [Methylophilaceae bacterium]